jgi:hypothetical protein
MYKKLLLLYLVLFIIINILFSIVIVTENVFLFFGLFIALGILGDILKKRSGGHLMKRGLITIRREDVTFAFVLFNIVMITSLLLLSYAFISLIF